MIITLLIDDLIADKTCSNPSLDFVAAPALAPAEVEVDGALMERYKQELAQVSSSPTHIDLDPDDSIYRPKLSPFPKKTTTCNRSL